MTFSSYTEEITAYPNPVLNELNIALNSEFIGDVTFQLFNTKGDSVQAFTLPKEHNIAKYQLNMENIPSGLYLLKIIQGKYHSVKKILK